MKKKRILFISAPFGSGHNRAAQAVIAAIGQLDNNVEMRLTNVFDFGLPYAGKWIVQGYLSVLDLVPQAYGLAYGWGNASSAGIYVRKFINAYFANQMINYITQYSPDVIVCTHATAAGLIATLRQKNHIKQKSIAIITDFVVHRWWVYPEIDTYFVAHEKMRDDLLVYNYHSDQVLVSGIPIDSKFGKKESRAPIAHRYGLSADLPTILIMGGGAGVLPMDDIFAACASVSMPLQIIAVAGENKKMAEKLAALAQKAAKPNIILGYINNVEELMDLADLLITKPGGLTSSEALAKNLPMLIYRPIPGQEEANTRYLTENMVAKQIDSVDKIPAIIAQLFSNSYSYLGKMRQNTMLISNPGAADYIAKNILQRIK